MEKPTDSEKIQLLAVLRVLDLNQDEVASMLHLAKATVVDTEKWIRTEDLQTVWDIFDDNVLKTTILRELPSLKEEEVTESILLRAPLVDRRAILLHYGRKVSEIEFEENLRDHREDLANVTRKVLDKLNSYIITWDDKMLIGEVIVEEGNPETIGFFQDKLVIGLFDHLKLDLPELASFSRWEDLRVKDITFKLINEISMKAARREFSGECGVCKVWMQK